ncbi:hypothetical protein GS597_04640 [Synechococcales cyanobacterium C]|uniref:DUF2126 domain-containing protein n=1 Tax=Petrachloros mirabilis ULC683 TaxID=2781853 RepID=A0A8K1ZXR3_9CYAN|nr:transglutaminase family protein [Petrachloros mirabilis]NCJ05807.1 hypothetical protein [Petrachloros mirabilis ULC683]
MVLTADLHQAHPLHTKQWHSLLELGDQVEQQLQAQGVGLMMGGEPTFVSASDFDSPQWQIAALGEDKRQLADGLLHALQEHFAPQGGLRHYGQGKWYPGEALPRWALGCFWRVDGQPLWPHPHLLAPDGKDCGQTLADAEQLMVGILERLGLSVDYSLPAFEVGAEEATGYVLPLLPVVTSIGAEWQSCYWQTTGGRYGKVKLQLIEGTSPMGLRLPLDTVEDPETWVEEPEEFSLAAAAIAPATAARCADNTIQVAFGIEVRQGTLHVFLPPFTGARSFADLLGAIAATAEQCQQPVVIEGYTPPGNQGIQGFQITPDPGVIEVNIHPVATWADLVTQTQVLYIAAQKCGLTPEKYAKDGRRLSTGGGAHITIGGTTVENSPLLRRPDLLRSLITYWQNHPSLTYLFSGLFVGATSQAPRIDEARHESLYELEIAFQTLQPQAEILPELVDRLLRNLLIDVTGNTHRAALCIDKLFPVENPRGRLGLLEFRAFAMPTHAQLRLVQLLLIRACVAWFWQQPYTHPLIRWGTTLHDRFLLPHYIEQDLQAVLRDLASAGFAFDPNWFQPFFDLRFPCFGTLTVNPQVGVPVQFELRHAIEPWPVLGEEVTGSSTARAVDSSMERLQVKLSGAMGHSANTDQFAARYGLLCNGQRIPLKSTGTPGEYVGGVRFRARQLASVLHPAIDPHSPLWFELFDTWSGQCLGAACYHVTRPDGTDYQDLPSTAEMAAARIQERFRVEPPPDPHQRNLPPVISSPEYPLTLDLRRQAL